MGGGGDASIAQDEGISGGSGVIPCWPNQLFDEIHGVCTYWQNVDITKCPKFDGSKMMPELTDENANSERFFVSFILLILCYSVYTFCCMREMVG